MPIKMIFDHRCIIQWHYMEKLFPNEECKKYLQKCVEKEIKSKESNLRLVKRLVNFV